MAATGFTPISIFYSTTASTAPTAGSLVNGELAINITDGVLYYKDNAGAVQKIGTKGGVGTSSTTQVLYNSSGLVVGSANLTFNGTTLTTANDASISGLTVGKGANAVAYNTAVGASALASGSLSGGFNSAFGNVALNANTTGASNSAFGYAALNSNTTGSSNTAYGLSSLLNNTTASNNTAVGYQAAYSNTTVGSNSVAVGYQALYGATNGYNVGVGSLTLTGSGNGYYNVAVGYTAGQANTTGYTNTFIGMAAGAANTTANQNTFVGQNAGTATTTGGGNTYVGLGAGQYNTTGTQNTLIGIGSGYTLTTGSKNSILGGYNGNQGGLDIRTASNYIVLSDGDGNPRLFINATPLLVCPPVYSNTTGSSANIFVDTSGGMYRSTSALKYKQDIRDLESIDINQFRPVRYKSKCTDDDQTIDHFGIIADEVDQAGIKELVSYGAEGEVEGFQYERLTVVLLKAIQELKAEIDLLKAK